MNSETEIKIRRHKNNLSIGGRGFIVFGIWSIIKTFMMLTMGDEFTVILDDPELADYDRTFSSILVIIIVVFYCVFILACHLVVGLNAIRYAKGKKNRIRFYVFTCIVTLVNMQAFTLYPISFSNGLLELNDTSIVSLLVDLTITLVLFNLLYSAINIDILKKRLQKEREES